MNENFKIIADANLETEEEKFLIDLQQLIEDEMKLIPRLYGEDEIENSYRSMILQAMTSTAKIFNQNYIDSVSSLKELEQSDKFLQIKLAEIRNYSRWVVGGNKQINKVINEISDSGFADYYSAQDMEIKLKQNFLKAISIYKAQTDFFLKSSVSPLTKLNIDPVIFEKFEFAYTYFDTILDLSRMREFLCVQKVDGTLIEIKSVQEYEEFVHSCQVGELTKVTFYSKQYRF